MTEIECVVIEPNATHPDGYEIINRSYTVTSLPVSGLDPNFEVLIKRKPYERPPYDSRLWKLITHIGPSAEGEMDEEYPEYRMWLETYTLEPESIEQIEKAIDETKNLRNLNHMSIDEMIEQTVCAIAAADKRAMSLNVTPEQEAFMTQFHDKGSKIWTNKQIAEQKKADLRDGKQVDLDAGWE